MTRYENPEPDNDNLHSLAIESVRTIDASLVAEIREALEPVTRCCNGRCKRAERAESILERIGK